MAHDKELADRIRRSLAHRSSVREVSMFGGLSFMVNGKLTVGAHNDGDLMLRCDPERVDDLLGERGAAWAEMNGRRMGKGWMVVTAEGIAHQEDFNFWIGVALEFNEELTGKDGR